MEHFHGVAPVRDFLNLIDDEELTELVGDGIYVTRLHYLSTVAARDGVITQEWQAFATHSKPIKRGDIEVPPTGNGGSVAICWPVARVSRAVPA